MCRLVVAMKGPRIGSEMTGLASGTDNRSPGLEVGGSTSDRDGGAEELKISIDAEKG